MIKTIALIILSVGVLAPVYHLSPVYHCNDSIPTQNITCCQSANLGLDEQIWGENGQPGDWRAMLASIDNSLRYLKSPAAANLSAIFEVGLHAIA